MPYNILLVDDDKEFREEFRDCFDDYQIVEASNGQEALSLLGKPNEVDLVILDVMMPGLRGTQVLKSIKEMSPGLGIIILTGHSSKDVAVEALKGHADEFIEKPMNVEKTKEIIDKLLADKDDSDDINSSGIQAKIERVKHFALRNYHKKVCLHDAAQAVALSPKYLSRIFKQNTGLGFNEFNLQIKIGKAKELLKETDSNIDQISDKLGYQNSESFIRIFKKLTKNTPTEYRKRNKIRNNKTVVAKKKQTKKLKRGKKHA